MTRTAGPVSGEWALLLATPLRLRIYLTVVALAALALPVALDDPIGSPMPEWVTAGALILVSVLNVEISRVLAGGLATTHQPHKALSGWAFASALLLPTPWLLVIVPVTYAHARWRGLRVPVWKWVWSAFYVVLAGVAAAAVRQAVMGTEGNLMAADGGRGLLALAAATAAFLAVEAVLFLGSATLNHAEDEVWLRATLRTWSFYATEAGVLLMGGLLASVWTGGPWLTLLFFPIYLLAQRAALHEPLKERAAAAVQLAAKNDELELANQFKIDLLGMLGHEVGTPLTAILGYSQIGVEAVRDGDLAGAEAALEVVERQAVQMQRVAHDVLALVSSDRGALTANPEPCDVASHLHVAAANDSLRETLVEVDCQEGLTALVQPGHLQQILTNLISNATKYAGGATRLTAAEDGRGGVEVAVLDAGPGVPAAFRAHLFERFSRDAESARRVMGTGLGLFISRELARANGGDLVYREASPTGSAFVITLPAPA